jgi:hypothetical protein
MLAVELPVILLEIIVCLFYVGRDRQFNSQHTKDKQFFLAE